MPMQQTPFIKKMIQYSQGQEKQIAYLIDLVVTNQLTADEAATSLAGRELKHNPQWARQFEAATTESHKQNAHESLMMACHLNIDRQLPDWKGMIVGRHI